MVQIIYYIELLKRDRMRKRMYETSLRTRSRNAKMRKRMYETSLRTRSRNASKRSLITAYEMDLLKNKFFDKFVRDNLEAIQTDYPKFFEKFVRLL